jgi:polysaccharide chain length determinant protein (PEP-CTERM system associated)
MLLRRKAWFIGPFVLSLLAAVLLIMFLPKSYRSSTLILVEEQKVPEEFVRSTVSEDIGGRLSTIQQEIMSRSFLKKIVDQFGLYKNLSGTEENIVEMMRKNVEIKTVIGHRDVDAFSISFVGSDPVTTMKVTNQLAALFIEQNLKFREQQVEGTSEFIDSELERLKKTLERQEALVTDFKRTHSGELPGQLEANLRTLDRLQITLQEIKMGTRIISERKLSEAAMSRVAEKAAERAEVASDPLLQRLNMQRLKLLNLQTLYKEKHPDVIALKVEIEELEKKLLSRPGVRPEAATSVASSADEEEATSQGVPTSSRELMDLAERERQVSAQIRDYEHRIDVIPQREQDLTSLLRDYENTQKNYQGLLDKKLNAKISENLEKRQKGEKFRILDAAALPERPYKPNPIKIVLAAIMAGFFGGLALVFVRESVDSTLHKPEELEAVLGVPILASILDYQEVPQRAEAAEVAVDGEPKKRGLALKNKAISMSKTSIPIKRGSAISAKKSRFSFDKQTPSVSPAPNLKSDSSPDLVSLVDPGSILSEQYRLLFLKSHRICQEKNKRILAITSSLKGEGKTTTACNLAITTARDFGKKTLLIDADFKNPSVGKYFKLKQDQTAPGLMDVVTKRCSLESALVKGPVENLTILPMGRISRKSMDNNLSMDGLNDVLAHVRGQYYNISWDDTSSDFLHTGETETGLFDYIFIDAPPIVPTFDMNLISDAVESILFVVRSGEAPKHIITRAMKLLDRNKIIGAVLNRASVPWMARAYEYGYYAYVADK